MNQCAHWFIFYGLPQKNIPVRTLVYFCSPLQILFCPYDGTARRKDKSKWSPKGLHFDTLIYKIIPAGIILSLIVG